MLVFADLPKIKRLDHLVEILQVLCAYQEAFPAIMEHASVDYGALLDGVMSVSQAEGGDIEEEEDEKNKEKRSILQLHMLKLLANAGSGQLALTKVVSTFQRFPLFLNPSATAGGLFDQYRMMQKKKLKMTETLAHRYSSENTHQELSNEYQHNMV